MAPQHKRAWITLVIGILWFPAWLGLMMARGKGITGFLQAKLWRGDMAFVVVFTLGLIALILVQVVFWGKRRGPGITADERDIVIVGQAKRAAAFVSFMTVLFAWLVPWSIYAGRGRQTVPIDFLALIGLAQAIVFFMTEAVTCLVLYGRESKGETL